VGSVGWSNVRPQLSGWQPAMAAGNAIRQRGFSCPTNAPYQHFLGDTVSDLGRANYLQRTEAITIQNFGNAVKMEFSLT
jgi:hypothetical protein